MVSVVRFAAFMRQTVILLHLRITLLMSAFQSRPKGLGLAGHFNRVGCLNFYVCQGFL